MNPESIEAQNAARLLAHAHTIAAHHSQPGDRDAVAVAMLYAAIELATPGQSPNLRASVFYGDTSQDRYL
jgi:hypothetical protein